MFVAFVCRRIKRTKRGTKNKQHFSPPERHLLSALWFFSIPSPLLYECVRARLFMIFHAAAILCHNFACHFYNKLMSQLHDPPLNPTKKFFLEKNMKENFLRFRTITSNKTVGLGGPNSSPRTSNPYTSQAIFDQLSLL